MDTTKNILRKNTKESAGLKVAQNENFGLEAPWLNVSFGRVSSSPRKGRNMPPSNIIALAISNAQLRYAAPPTARCRSQAIQKLFSVACKHERN